MNVLVWFKRDLRIHDHPALARAVELAASTGGAIIPLYVVEPDYWRLPDTSGRQWAFTAEALEDLRAELADIGAPLIVRIGDAVRTIDQICADHNVTRIVSHEETGNLWTFARDRRVAAWARGSGIVWDELPQCGVVRALRDRKGWVARRDAFQNEPILRAPQALRGLGGLEPGAIPTAIELQIANDPCPQRQTGGRREGLALLESFLTHRGEPYRTAMSSPIGGEVACSRVSPHLALGTLSGREAGRATMARRAEKPGGSWPGALTSFERRIAWREYFMQRLESNPRLENQLLHRAAESLRPRMGDPLLLAAWTTGETGLPFVDACIRYLAATGWLNFRMRSMVMSFASYHLWLDCRQTGPVLARAFTDYEPGIHWSQVQMQSGVTGFNTPRIYNPIKQGYDQDPTGAFTRRWCPELADVPDAFLQEPWKWFGASGLLGNRYPEPVIDVTASGRAARDAIFALRKRADDAQIAAMAARNRTPNDPRFNVKRPGRKIASPAKPTSQLSFDL